MPTILTAANLNSAQEDNVQARANLLISKIEANLLLGEMGTYISAQEFKGGLFFRWSELKEKVIRHFVDAGFHVQCITRQQAIVIDRLGTCNFDPSWCNVSFTLSATTPFAIPDYLSDRPLPGITNRIKRWLTREDTRYCAIDIYCPQGCVLKNNQVMLNRN
ncbi:MAG: hypothetical protein K2W82_17070 [Candidatus Obscuribacterales bacterium]|nr:hypothetical protein [Candidatus Obscuribacterales bacterium]